MVCPKRGLEHIVFRSIRIATYEGIGKVRVLEVVSEHVASSSANPLIRMKAFRLDYISKNSPGPIHDQIAPVEPGSACAEGFAVAYGQINCVVLEPLKLESVFEEAGTA
jgi:hypothetical protein